MLQKVKIETKYSVLYYIVTNFKTSEGIIIMITTFYFYWEIIVIRYI